MPHVLENELARVRRRVRLLVVLHALAWLVGGLVAALLVFGLADYLIHFQDVGIRLMCSFMVLNVVVLAASRYLWPAVRTEWRDVDLAMRVEKRFPELNERFASTIEFLKQPADDPQGGSALLRREVIHETTALVEPLDLRDVLDSRPVVKALAGAAAICLLGLTLLLVAPQSSRLALARLANPLGGGDWPKANHLVFNQPVTRIALGSRFEVELTDALRAELPREVRIHYRYDNEGPAASERVEPMKRIRDTMVASIDEVVRPFSYRAEGGDDDSMPWTALEVIEPPAIEQLSVTLHYPSYTSWPPASSEPHLRALVGTRVEFHGKTTKPLRSVTLKLEDGTAIPGRITDQGHAFDFSAQHDPSMVVTKSGTYTFDMEDTEGFHGGQGVRYEMRALEDRPPTVNIEQPSADAFVTATATVPLRILAKDDLAVRKITLHVAPAAPGKDEAAETRVPLYTGPEPAAAPEDQANAESRVGESRTVDHRLDLGPLKLQPGGHVVLHASASDYKPSETSSHFRRLTILTTDQLQERLAERQAAILGELGRMLKLEHESRAQVTGLEIQVDHVGNLNKQDLDHLQQAELTQRQVDRGLGNEREGVQRQIENLLSDLTNNKIDNSDVQRRMQALRDELARLGENTLPAISRNLTSALKNFQAQDPPAENTPAGKKPAEKTPGGQALAEAGQRQDEVIHSLEQMLSELSEWDNYRRFHREIGQLRREQEELAADTGKLGNQTLTKDVEDLDAQQQADLKKLGQRQLEMARHFDKIQQQMEEISDKLRETDPLAADAVADALHQARQQALAGEMREAGRNVEQNQVGQAGQRQQKVMKELDELLDILANRRERELGRLVKKLQEAEQKLAELRKQQSALRKKMEQAAQQKNEAGRRELERLSREQKQLQAEVERFARTLRRLQADEASRTASKSGSKMGQAGQQGQQGNGQQAAEQAAGAEQDLEDAQKQLAQQRQRTEADLAAEQIARLEDNLRGLKQQQEKLLTETRHYDSLREKNGRLSRAEAMSVRNLARAQQLVEEETTALATKLASAIVFGQALKNTARDMATAARLLGERDTAAATQAAQQHALTRIEQLVTAMKPNSGQQKEGGKQGGGSGQSGGQGGQNGIPSMAQVILLKLMQQDINQRTRALSDLARKQRELTPEQQEDLSALGEEQGRLADLLLELTKPDKEGEDVDPGATQEKER